VNPSPKIIRMFFLKVQLQLIFIFSI